MIDNEMLIGFVKLKEIIIMGVIIIIKKMALITFDHI